MMQVDKKHPFYKIIMGGKEDINDPKTEKEKVFNPEGEKETPKVPGSEMK